MPINIGINGLGRIGRCVMRAALEEGFEDINIIAVNGPAPIETHAHLLKYDSVHGRFSGEIEIGEAKDSHDTLIMSKGDKKQEIALYHTRNPEEIPWGEMGVDIVLECTGKFNKASDCQRHLQQGAKKVLLSAPAKDECPTVVFGVNNDTIQDFHDVISIGSCTTNCLAPVAKLLDDEFGIEAGVMTTIHAYTGDQNLVDGSHSDMQRARAAGLSMVPSKTGAAQAIGLVLPQLAGKLTGGAVRVPTANVSMVDLTVTLDNNVSAEIVNAALSNAANGSLKGVLEVSDEPLVSIDYAGHSASSIVDLNGTQVVGDKLVRIAAWYDNEWGFSCRMLDMARLVANK